jgi:uncharacterized membrane protein YfcA
MNDSYLLLMCAAFVAGVMNSVAGGGTFLTFPALVFTGVPSVIANATSTVSLFPGAFASAWAYRNDFKALKGIPVVGALAVSCAGGVIGATLLLFTSESTFDSIVPWLLLLASTAFAFGPYVAKAFKNRSPKTPRTLLALQFLIAIYGGYFGGAVGIIMLGIWSIIGITDIHAMNAGRTLLGGTMNAAAVVLFIAAGKVWWPQTAIMLVAAVTGGYVGARLARRTNAKWVRIAAIVLCFSVTVVFFIRS